MAAYEAVVTLNHGINNQVNKTGIWLCKYHPSLLEILQFVGKELKTFQEFVEGLDVKSRRRMKVELQRVKQATKQFQKTLAEGFEELTDRPEVMFDKCDEYYGRQFYELESENIVDLEQLRIDLEEYRQMARSFIDTLKEVQEEYLKVQDEDEDEDEDEAPVDLGGMVVGLSDVYSDLKRVVVSTDVDDHVVSLCGMTGIGKTTLAKKLFQDLDVLDWFKHCVWVTVGMRFQPQEITQSILAQMDLDPHDMTSEDYLRKHLKGKRYLIVLDDVCDMELCQSYINNSFPEVHGRSKVLLTTRIQDNSLSHHLIPVRLLDKQESWDLLCDKVFAQNCTLTTQSLLCFGPYHQYPVPICFDLKLLKKFDALQIRFYHFPLEILELVKLRYLALTCHGSLPPSIAKLSKLQYLMVHQHLSVKYGELSYLPVQIWDMKRLKHLHVMGVDLPDSGGKFLPKLLTLSGVSFNSCTSGVVSGIPNLKKLGIQIELMPNEVEPLYCFDHISHFKELQSLKCVIVNPTCNFKGVAPLVPLSIFSVSLKKLYLSGLGYPWEEARMISSLPNLEALKLRNNAFKGPEWAVEDYAFPKLCCLVMEDLDLMILKGGYASFTLLKKVSIKHCYNLKTFRPTDDYDFLAKSSEVIDCNPLVGREIQKGVLQTGNYTNYLSIKSSWNS